MTLLDPDPDPYIVKVLDPDPDPYIEYTDPQHCWKVKVLDPYRSRSATLPKRKVRESIMSL